MKHFKRTTALLLCSGDGDLPKKQNKKNLQLPGTGQTQPTPLEPYLKGLAVDAKSNDLHKICR